MVKIVIFFKVAILLSFCVTSFGLNSKSFEIETKSHAISSLIDILHETHHLRFILIVQKNDSYLGKLADRILQLTRSSITVKFYKKLKRYYVDWENSYLFLIKDESSFIDWDRSMKYQTKVNYVFIHPKHSNETVLERLDNYGIASYKKFYFIDSYEYNSFKLINGVRVKPESCNYEWKTVNSYNTIKKKWSQKEFVQKFDNFYQCSVVVYMNAEKVQYSSYLKFQEVKGKQVPSGIYIDIMNLFAAKYNIDFKVDLVGNETSTTQLRIYPSMFRHIRGFLGMITTPPIKYDYFTFMVSRGVQYTPFEKLLLPFDLPTWIMVIITFAIGFLTILILYQCPRNVQQFVFGTYNEFPSLSLTQIFFGIGLIRTPNRNFARYLFMIFSMYCLVIRTAYQGKMFDFLHSNAEKPTPNSRDELIQQKIPVLLQMYSNLTKDEVAFQIKNVKKTAIVHPDLNLKIIQEDPKTFIKQSDEIYSSMIVRSRGRNENKRNIGSGISSFLNEKIKILSDDYDINESSWYLEPRTQEIFTILEMFILELHQHGIIKHFENLADVENNTEMESKTGPQVLTMQILSAGFIVWIITILAGCIAFVVEHIVRYYTITRYLKK